MKKSLNNLFPLLYKKANRYGLLNSHFGQSLFIFSYFSYKKYFEDPYKKFVKNFSTVFQQGHVLDVGANIGYTSYVFSKILPSPYKVFAFEPEENNIALLKKVANTYRFLDRLFIIETAVGDREGEIELWKNEGHHADHRIITEKFRKNLDSIDRIQKSPLVTIDKFLEKNNAISPIAFIKIDVQGFETAVCHGMEKTLSLNPSCCIGIEYCPLIMESLGYCGKELIQFFERRNYLLYKLNKNGTLQPLNVATDKYLNMGKDFKGYFDIICSRQKLLSLPLPNLDIS